MSVSKFFMASAAVAVVLFSAAAPAEAGRRTGTWKYSPQEVYAAQRAQRQQQYYGSRRGYGYNQGYGRAQGYGYRQQRRYENPNAAPFIAGPSGGGQGTYGRP